MPQKKPKKTKHQSSANKKIDNSGKILNKIKEIKHKKEVSPIRHKTNHRMFRSVGGLSNQNKKVKHIITQKSQPKSSTQRDVSTDIFQEMKPNREYYGQETSFYIHNKCQNSPKLRLSQCAGKTSSPKTDQLVYKILKFYRSLQRNHSSQLDEYVRSLSKNELHRLRRIQEYELRQQMEKLVDLEQRTLFRRR